MLENDFKFMVLKESQIRKKGALKISLYARISFLQQQNMPYFSKLCNEGNWFGSANSKKSFSLKKGPALVTLVI